MLTIEAAVGSGGTLAPAEAVPEGARKIVFDGAAYKIAMTDGEVAELDALLPTPQAMPLPMSKLDFLAHFTDVQIGSALAKPGLAVFWVKFNAAGYLERDNPLTTAGLAALVAEGVTTQEAADQLLAGWPTS